LAEGEIKDVTFPKEILECNAISREIVFKSAEEIKEFSLLQNITMHG
jgi:hypothetical protein